MKSILLIKKAVPALLMVLLAVLLSSCGGTDSSRDNIIYTGFTGRAVIDADNALELTLSAYYGGPVYLNIPAIITTEDSADQIQLPLQYDTLWYSLPLNKMISYFTVYDDSALQLQTIIGINPEVISGNCGGSATITVQIDDGDGDFTGTIQNNNYCEDGVTTSGLINLSGSSNITTGEITMLNISSNLLTLSSSSYSLTLRGNIISELSGNSQTQTLNYLIRDNQSEKVYKIENYIISTALLIDRIEMTFSGGRFYSPEYGYVEVISVQPFARYLAEFALSAGELKITGDIPTKALLTVLDVNDFTIRAFSSDENIFEWTGSTDILN